GAACRAAGVKILDVVVGQPDAAGRHVLADCRGLVGAVDAVERLAEIERARAAGVPFPPPQNTGGGWRAPSPLPRTAGSWGCVRITPAGGCQSGHSDIFDTRSAPAQVKPSRPTP